MKRIRNVRKKILYICLAMFLVVGMTPIMSQAASDPSTYTFDISEGRISIYNGTDEGTIKVYYGSGQNIDNIPATENITIIQSGDTATTNCIYVGASCNVNITLVNVNIDSSSISNTAVITNFANLTIELEGTNTLLGNYYGPTIFNYNEAALVINDVDNDGTLYATSGVAAAGIQGNNITINGGTIVATGGENGAGIGGGYASCASNITINGGNVTATGGKQAAGIGGGGSGSNNVTNNITITGGTVKATGGAGAAGIGGSASGINGKGDATNITISGGNVTATGGGASYINGYYIGAGAGIGGGGSFDYLDSRIGKYYSYPSGKGTGIQITGNAIVTATAGENTFPDGVPAKAIGAGGTSSSSLEVGESSHSTIGLTGSLNGISLPIITTDILIDGFADITYYNQKIEVSNSNSDTVFSISEGQLPTGLIIDSQTGVISGTLPDTTGTYTFKVKVTNSIGSVEKEYSITVCASVSNPEKNPTEASNTITGITAGQKFTSGDTVTFTAVGGGDTDTPIAGETRWVPVSWKVNPEGDFATGNTQSFSTTGMTIGEHTLTVTFAKQTFDGTSWMDTSVTADKSVSFVIEAASTTESSDGTTTETPIDADTPDTGDFTSMMLLFVMFLSATGIMMNVKGLILKS